MLEHISNDNHAAANRVHDMATGQVKSVIQHLRKAALVQNAGALKDGELLEAFLACREQPPK